MYYLRMISHGRCFIVAIAIEIIVVVCAEIAAVQEVESAVVVDVDRSLAASAATDIDDD